MLISADINPPVIYKLYDCSGDVVYIGKSTLKNLIARINHHKKDKEFTHYSFDIILESEADVLKIEEELIRDNPTVYNKHHTGNADWVQENSFHSGLVTSTYQKISVIRKYIINNNYSAYDFLRAFPQISVSRQGLIKILSGETTNPSDKIMNQLLSAVGYTQYLKKI